MFQKCQLWLPCWVSQTALQKDTESDDSLKLKVAKEKLRPLNLLLNNPETASMSFDQLLAQCNLTLSEYERCLHMMNQSNTRLER